MNTVSLNTVLLDGGTIIKKGDGGGGATINNQNKTVEIVENGSLSVVADSGYTGLGEVAINVNVPTSGGGGVVSVAKNDVNFYDYDGTRLYSYTWAEAQAMTELPALPEREGLICQEWNYSLEDIKAQNGKCDVGATYITDDGKTRIYLHITTDARMTFPLCFSQSVANGVVIDWGDGSATEVVEGTSKVKTTHTYASIGDYVISLAPNDGCTLNFEIHICGTGSTPSFRNMIQKIEIGANVTSISSNAFQACYSLSSVAIPNSVTSIDSAFPGCHSLSSIAIPSGVTRIGDSVVSGCSTLSSIAIPSGVKRINTETFYNCSSLAICDFSTHTAVPSLGTSVFYKTPSDLKIIVPDALYDEWIAATNWSSYASQIVKASEV